MNKIPKQLQKLKEEKRLGLMTHIVAGYPTLEKSRNLVLKMIEVGVDFIEIQLPFSDPVADGPTLMEANKIALKSGTKVKDVFEMVKSLQNEVDIPLLFMGYYNIPYNYGIKSFCKNSSLVGISGTIFPDFQIDHEQDEHFDEYLDENDITNIRVLSPASTEERIIKNVEKAKGFIYYVGRKGVTGAKEGLDPALTKNLEFVRKYTNLPIAVGFGISKPEHIDSLVGVADIAIIGSQAVKVYNESNNEKEALTNVGEFLKLMISRTTHRS